MSEKQKFVLILLVVIVVCIFVLVYLGCSAVHYEVKKVIDRNQEGLRFNRPVPYLVITNMGFGVLSHSQAGGSVISSEGDRAVAGGNSGTATAEPAEKVIATLIWLPEKRETYAITVKGGRGGTFKGSINLADGWMLTGFSEEGDTKAAEMLSPLTGLISGVTSTLAAKPKAATGVQATAQPKSAFFYLFRIDLTNNALKLVNGKEMEDLLSGRNVFNKPKEAEDIDPILKDEDAAQSAKGGAQ